MKPTWTERDLREALNAVANGMSQRQASAEYCIPRATLQFCINGGISRLEARIPQQRLSTVQEDHLMQWVLAQESLGLPPIHNQVRLFAGRIMQVRGDAKPLGKR